MPEFLSVSLSKQKKLNPGESVELPFDVKNPGNVVAIAKAGYDKIFPPDPTKRLLEIFVPGKTTPEAKKLDEGFALVTFLKAVASNTNKGMWKARVTNREDSAQTFKLSVSYPGTKELKSFTVPLSLINSFINATVKNIEIYLTDGTNKSSFKFPASLGVPAFQFTVPKYSKRYNLPWPIPDITITEKIWDIKSKSVSANLANARPDYIFGSFDIKVSFETSGHEIKGTIDANIGNMNLDVALGIIVENGKITYSKNNIAIKFPITINLVNVPDVLENIIDGLTGFKNQIKDAVIKAIRNVFAAEATRQAFSNALNNQILPLLGTNAKIVSAKVEGGNLTVKYYNA